MKTIREYMQDLEDIDAVARGCALTEWLGHEDTLAIDAIRDLESLLERQSTDNERLLLVRRYRFWSGLE